MMSQTSPTSVASVLVLPRMVATVVEAAVSAVPSFHRFDVMRDQFRCMLKIGKIESWSGFELFQPYFLLTISRDREGTRDF